MRKRFWLIILSFLFPVVSFCAAKDSLSIQFPETNKKMHFRKYERKVYFSPDSTTITIVLTAWKKGSNCQPENQTGHCEYRRKTWIYHNRQLLEYSFELGKTSNGLFQVTKKRVIDYDLSGRRLMKIIEHNSRKKSDKRVIFYKRGTEVQL